MQIHFDKDLPLIDIDASLFIEDTPLLDVRAEVEFDQGAFVQAINSPLLTNQERHEVGIRYKEAGQDEAIELGAQLITDEIRQQRVARWVEFVQANPKGVLYCFRGGMRSKITQQWIFEYSGIKYPRINGGYKALRRFLIESNERLIAERPLLLVSGSTGSGKTRFLEKIPFSVDLEGLANHRGSAFGAMATPQPTQINFENNLAVDLLKHEANFLNKRVVLEDEGHNIGGVHLPMALPKRMATSPIVHLKVSDEERLQTSLQVYATDMLADYQNNYAEELAFEKFSEAILGSLGRIKKRLGGERYRRLKQLAEQALLDHKKTGNGEAHIAWVSELLVDYYDPMYEYQLSKKTERIVFVGNQQEIIEYLEDEQLT